MSSLFLDTSSKIAYGLLSDENEWLEYHCVEDKKASKVLHALIYKCLKDNNLELKDLKRVFYLSGPGSYTGVRLAQGFVEILEWQKFEVFSCRHFDLPRLLGIERGLFVSRAFKQEAFVHEWNGASHEERLEPETAGFQKVEEFQKRGISCFTSEPNFYKGCLSTYDLVEKEPQRLFKILSERKMRSPVFYYRNLEQEFQKEKQK